jgi:hypothetical protein
MRVNLSKCQGNEIYPAWKLCGVKRTTPQLLEALGQGALSGDDLAKAKTGSTTAFEGKSLDIALLVSL